MHLSVKEWTSLAEGHRALLEPYTDSFLKRRSLNQKHPVYDFLFVYYSFSPTKLKNWVPPLGVTLEIEGDVLETYPWLLADYFVQEGPTLKHNPSKMGLLKRELPFIIELFNAILDRPPRFGCLGLHEWAMVYKMSPEAIRHQGWPLRLTPKEIEAFVESQTLQCTHYDAYRFFTPEARPLNIVQPTLASRVEREQGGCIHANMDLYKWAYKLWPWIGSEFLQKAFFLAVEARELDMRASPYDLREAGLVPIPLETLEGQKAYQKEQMALAQKAKLLREEMLESILKVSFAFGFGFGLEACFAAWPTV